MAMKKTDELQPPRKLGEPAHDAGDNGAEHGARGGWLEAPAGQAGAGALGCSSRTARTPG
jgi:hypothetical protein